MLENLEKQIFLLTFASHLKTRAFSSAGLEHLPYKQRVGGSNPSTPTGVFPVISSEVAGFFRLYTSRLKCNLGSSDKQAQWKFSGDKHKSLQVYTERTFHQRYLLVML